MENYEQVWAEHSKKKDHMAWYEFTPFEIGCDEQAGKYLYNIILENNFLIKIKLTFFLLFF